MADASHRRFKDRLYAQYARIGKALGNPHRLELLELLAQSERTVESLANEIGVSMANTSQHLQVLRGAGLVDTRRTGLFVHYRLSDDAVVPLSTALRTVAERRLADLDRLVRDEFKGRAEAEAVSFADLLERSRRDEVVILDTRPTHEYQAGHIPGALSVPVDELQQRLRRLPEGEALRGLLPWTVLRVRRSRGRIPSGEWPQGSTAERGVSGMEGRRIPC